MFDSLYGGNNYLLWLLPGIALTLFSQYRLKSKFGKYKQVPNSAKLSGQDVARQVLDSEQLQKIPVLQVQGSLTDHYDPRKKTINLSQPIYAPKTIASMAVAAHETGHAIQDKDGYVFMKLRGLLVPLANIGTNLGYLLILMGLVTGAAQMARIGVLLFAMSTLFALVTLPVEFDASKRAKQKLKDLGLTKPEEDKSVDTMLDAAAFTYVAAFATSAIQLFYWASTVRKANTANQQPAPSVDRRSSTTNTRASSSSTSGGVKIERSDDTNVAPKRASSRRAQKKESTRESRRS